MLWALRGWRWWTDFARLIGVAYLLGLSTLIILSTLELVIGIPVDPVTMLLSGTGLVAASIVVGRLEGSRRLRSGHPTGAFRESRCSSH